MIISVVEDRVDRVGKAWEIIEMAFSIMKGGMKWEWEYWNEINAANITCFNTEGGRKKFW